MMDRLRVCVIAVSVGGLVTPGAAVAQDLGQFFVHVVSQTGQPITDLTPNEFTVMEDQTECEVVSAQLGTAPMKVALLVDNGDQIAKANALIPLRAGLDAFLATLPAQHEVGLFTIGGNIQWRVDFTTDRDELRQSAGEIFVDAGSGPVLLDGIKETWERRFEKNASWPVFVLVVTDGTESSGNMNEDKYQGLVTELVSGGATIHVVLLSSRGGSIVTNYAINLTENTGGLYSSIAAATGFTNTLTEFATRIGANYDEVSDRYRVVYERPDPPGARISVGVSRSGVRVRLYPDRQIKP